MRCSASCAHLVRDRTTPSFVRFRMCSPVPQVTEPNHEVRRPRRVATVAVSAGMPLPTGMAATRRFWGGNDMARQLKITDEDAEKIDAYLGPGTYDRWTVPGLGRPSAAWQE